MLHLFLGILLAVTLAGAIGVGLYAVAEAIAVAPKRGVPSILAVLPRTDCGACGYPGCEAYAEAISAAEEPFDRCLPGGVEVVEAIEVVLRRRKRSTRPSQIVQVHCRGGGGDTAHAYSYRGMEDCSAVYELYQGQLACKDGCLGLGSCVRACPVEAIYYDDRGKVWVDPKACTGCGICVSVCPTGVLKWVPVDADVIVVCNNHEAGDRVAEICSVGCTGCRICERKSPGAGYAVADNLAAISYGAGGNRLPGARSCPSGCVVPASGRVEELSFYPAEEANEED